MNEREWGTTEDGAMVEIIPFMPGDKVKIKGNTVHIITIVDYYYIVFKWFERPTQRWRYGIEHNSAFQRMVEGGK